MRYHIVLRYVGIILLINAAFLFISAIISFLKGDSALFPLIYTCLIAALFGAFPFIFIPPTEEISIKEGFTIVVSSWLLSCLIGMIPYVLWGGEFTLTNAWFESVSGFTTTGSSILTNIEALPDGLLFWRSATQWIGGVGIIIFALSVLPSMGKIGMMLYRSEISPLAAANFRYQTRETLRIIMTVYVGLTVAETIALVACGMSLFDAINHSFTTIATGGFSPKNLSVAYYRSPQIETIIMIFMILSGINFGLLFLSLSGKLKVLLRSTVLRTYLIMLFAGVVLVAVNIHGAVYGGWGETIRHAAFQVISIGTSTGFASTDSNIWPPFSQMLIVFFTLLCACSGSTSGGIKVDRAVLLWHAIKKRITKVQHTHAVVKAKIEGIAIDDDVLEASLLYIILYVAIVFVSSLLICFMGIDIMTAFSASAATMGNVGPGFGLVGSVSNFGNIPEIGKWILTGDMLLGRLEIFGLLLFFLLRSWK
ncbi:MAG: TrkH family potassium uptake protein [Deltaproteobacteria bacterium]|nr:TrkH family potassium uptake protein [Deltaproteobacteria bacterium]MBN2845357.1 TrkH family potassium uptake protein [Deltaproteobacteria bacterium]